MKNLLLIILALFIGQMTYAQVKIGLRGGLSTADITTEQLRIKNANDFDALGLSIVNANYGVHFGGFLQIKAGKFFLQPEAIFNSNSVDYKVEDLIEGQTLKNIARENYQYLDIPIMAGLKFGALRLQGGPVAHMFIDSNSELTDISGYDPQFEKWTWGYQAGIGLDIWRFLLDVKYEGSFNSQYSHFNFFGNQYQFDKTPGRFVASLGFAF